LGKRTTSFANPGHEGVPVARKAVDLYSSVQREAPESLNPVRSTNERRETEETAMGPT